MIDVASSNEDWLSEFFSGRNQLRWKDLKSNKVPEFWSSEVTGWLALLEARGTSTPVCLPLVSEDGSVQWYAGARSLQGSHALADELHAFVGPSYSGFDDRPHQLDPNDPQEAALKNFFVGSVFRVEGHTEKQVSNLNRVFSLFRTLLIRRPSSLRPAIRPFGVVRGLFDRAISAGNEVEARALLAEMQRSGRLTSENLKFLEVRLLAGLGLWDQIVLESNLLTDLTDFRLPPRVVRDVSEAFFRFYVQPFDEKGGLEACLEKLRASSLMRLDKLFSQRHNIQHPAVIKVFLLRELLRDQIDRVYADTLFSDLSDNDTTPLVLEISKVLKAKQAPDPKEVEPPDLRQQADAAYDEDDYDRALVLYLKVPADFNSVRRMIVCARFAGDEKSAREVIGHVATDPSIELDERTLGALETLKKQANPIPEPEASPDSEGAAASTEVAEWLNWARWVTNGADQQKALATLRQHSEAWSVEALCQDHESVAAFSSLIGNAGGEAEQIFKAAFDDIFQTFLLDLEHPPSSLKPLYRDLLFLLAASESLSRNDLSVTTQLTSSLLAFGLTAPEYQEVIDLLNDLFESERALRSLDWALDLVEELVLERCQDEEARLRFFTNVSLFAQQSAHRITESQRRALESLYQDFALEVPDELKDVTDSEPDEDSKSVSERLAGKRIGIYTLIEPAGKRAADRLKQLAPDSEILLNSDHECSERLSALAKSADIFIFAWKSSKHQAFYCVKDHRPKDLPLLQPLGKGSASIIREVLDYA
jgi:hypothetical protein